MATLLISNCVSVKGLGHLNRIHSFHATHDIWQTTVLQFNSAFCQYELHFVITAHHESSCTLIYDDPFYRQKKKTSAFKLMNLVYCGKLDLKKKHVCLYMCFQQCFSSGHISNNYSAILQYLFSVNINDKHYCSETLNSRQSGGRGSSNAGVCLFAEHTGSRSFGGILLQTRLCPCPHATEHWWSHFAHTLWE